MNLILCINNLLIHHTDSMLINYPKHRSTLKFTISSINVIPHSIYHQWASYRYLKKKLDLISYLNCSILYLNLSTWSLGSHNQPYLAGLKSIRSNNIRQLQFIYLTSILHHHHFCIGSISSINTGHQSFFLSQEKYNLTKSTIVDFGKPKRKTIETTSFPLCSLLVFW